MSGKVGMYKRPSDNLKGKQRKKQLHPYQRELTENQIRAARLWVFGKEGGIPITSKSALAVECGISDSTLYRYFALDRFQDEIERLLRDQKRENDQAIVRYVPKAIDSLAKALDAPQARDRIHAAKAILEMAGYGGERTININVNDVTGVVRGGFGREQIEGAQSVMVSDAEIVDADYEIVVEGSGDDDV